MSVGDPGAQYDLIVRQGATFGPVSTTLRNPDTTPVNLTGCTVRGQVRRSPGDAVVLAAFDVAITDAAGGVFVFGLDSTTTAAIPATPALDQWTCDYVWDLEMQDSLGRVIPLLWGTFTLHLEVTR